MTPIRTMLAGTALGLAALLPFAAPASAQVQPGNPNAANQSLSTMSTNRAIQQDQTSQNNMIRMDMQRSQNAPPTPAPPVTIPRGGR